MHTLQQQDLFTIVTKYVTCLTVLILATVIHLPDAAATSRCEALFPVKSSELFKWGDKKGYIESLQNQESMGQVQTFFSQKWETQVYYTSTGLPNHLGKAPLVDPNAKAVYIFFHGSGTMKSSGKNFIGNMNALSKLGYAALSFDMPFHANGPRRSEMERADVFMEWIKEIVTEVKKIRPPRHFSRTFLWSRCDF